MKRLGPTRHFLWVDRAYLGLHCISGVFGTYLRCFIWLLRYTASETNFWVFCFVSILYACLYYHQLSILFSLRTCPSSFAWFWFVIWILFCVVELEIRRTIRKKVVSVCTFVAVQFLCTLRLNWSIPMIFRKLLLHRKLD